MQTPDNRSLAQEAFEPARRQSVVVVVGLAVVWMVVQVVGQVCGQVVGQVAARVFALVGGPVVEVVAQVFAQVVELLVEQVGVRGLVGDQFHFPWGFRTQSVHGLFYVLTKVPQHHLMMDPKPVRLELPESVPVTVVVTAVIASVG